MSNYQNQVPSNIPVEQSLLGALIIDTDAIYEIADTLAPEDFYREINAWIYDALLYLHNNQRQIDTLTIGNELEKRKQLDQIGGPAYLTGLTADAVTGLHSKDHARIVRETAILRRLLFAAGKIAQLTSDGSNADEALAEAHTLLSGVDGENAPADIEPAINVLQRVVNSVSDRADGNGAHIIPTGYQSVDAIVGGFQRGDLWIVAGRPGMGKSAYAMGKMLNAAKTGAHVAIFSLEMSADQLFERILSAECRIDNTRLRAGNLYSDEPGLLFDAANALAKLPIWISDKNNAKVSQIRAKAAKLKALYGIDILMVDYLQLMSPSGKAENRNIAIGQISRELAIMASELDITIVALSQLSRAVESRADKRPMLSDLRDSGSLEQDASVVQFIYREEYYIEDTERQGIAEIITAKYRHGSTGTSILFFDGPRTMFGDIEIIRTDIESDEEYKPDPLDDVKHRISDIDTLAEHPAYAGLGG